MLKPLMDIKPTPKKQTSRTDSYLAVKKKKGKRQKTKDKKQKTTNNKRQKKTKT